MVSLNQLKNFRLNFYEKLEISFIDKMSNFCNARKTLLMFSAWQGVIQSEKQVQLAFPESEQEYQISGNIIFCSLKVYKLSAEEQVYTIVPSKGHRTIWKQKRKHF